MTQYQHTSVSNQSRTTVRLPLASNKHINAFTGAEVSNYAGLIFNGIVDSYTNEPERTYVTHRPSITVTNDASDNTTNANGRGIHYWSATGVTYIVNYDTVYVSDYTSACTVYEPGSAFAAGTEKVYFQEWSSAYEDYLFIINPENNQIFVIASQSPTVLINLYDSIADTGAAAEAPFTAEVDSGWDFTGLPLNNSQELCHGAVALDTYLFLGCKSGRIYNSNVDDWLNWNALGFTTAERENDQLLFIEKTKDHVAAFGERSVELFYDAGNAAPGSPLSARQDIAYRVGIVNGQSAWADGDDIHFLGMKPAGDFSVYVMKSFELQERINPTLNSYLKNSRTQTDLYTVGSGMSTGGHTYFILTVFEDDTNKPIKSIIYDTYTQFWYEWETTILGNSKYPLMGWSIRTPEVPVTAKGIFSNGDVFRLNDNFVPVDDTNLGDYYFAEDYLEDNGSDEDYMLGYTEGDSYSDNFGISITIDNFEGLSSEDKFMHSLEYVGNKTKEEQLLSVEWSDDEGETWLSASIDLSNRFQINRLGMFVRRKFRVGYHGDQQLRIEGLDVTYTQGGS